MDEDFVHWDDLDLDYVLGSDYTDDGEFVNDFDNEDEVDNDDITVDQNEDAEQNVKKRKSVKENIKPNEKKTANASYSCPDCDKIFKSIGGFRGHVLKKHGRSDLKAHNHKVQQSTAGGTGSKEEKNSEEEKISSFFHFETFKYFAFLSITTAITNVIEDPMNQIANSFYGKQMVEIAKSLRHAEHSASQNFTTIKTVITENLHQIFLSVGSGVKLGAEREMMFHKFHRFRLDTTKINELIMNVKSIVSQEDPVILRMFFQDWLLRIFENILKNQVEKMKSESEKEIQQISFNDQNVLFYICGFIIRSLKKKYQRIPLEISAVLSDIVNKLERVQGQTSFVLKFAKWTNISDRGGLKIPSDEMFFLVREFENVLKKNVNTEELSAHSLLKDKLKENIMESFMVKYHWGEMTDNAQPETLKIKVLEDMIDVFLKVRGHAIAKSVKRKIQKTVKIERKSHRKTLKEKSGQ